MFARLKSKIGLCYLKLYARVFPKRYADSLYRKSFGKHINWKHPEDLNQWINVLQYSSDISLWPTLADKYRVRKYVENKGLGDTLVKLYGKWDRPEDIEFDSLPKSFVLKSNNGSGQVMIVEDKSELNLETVRKVCKEWLKVKFGLLTGEPHYLKIKPCIIAEELLDVTKQTGESTSLIDYKIWCFGGEPHVIYAVTDRNKGFFTQHCYDTEWRDRSDLLHYDDHHLKPKDGGLHRPHNLNKMLEYARILSAGYPQMRVDLYEVDGKVYFGELTMSSNCGRMEYFTPEALQEFGKFVAANTKR